jgi:hypothetical protein
MPERDWAKEMKKIDRQLESISDEALFPAKTGAAKGPKAAAARAENLEKQRTTSTLGVFLRLLLSVALGVGIYFWPYDARCGFGLFGYLAAVGAGTHALAASHSVGRNARRDGDPAADRLRENRRFASSDVDLQMNSKVIRRSEATTDLLSAGRKSRPFASLRMT